VPGRSRPVCGPRPDRPQSADRARRRVPSAASILAVVAVSSLTNAASSFPNAARVDTPAGQLAAR
jgi:hypothetical protein